MAKIVTLFDIFLTILERNANDETRNFVLPHLPWENGKIRLPLRRFLLFFTKTLAV